MASFSKNEVSNQAYYLLNTFSKTYSSALSARSSVSSNSASSKLIFLEIFNVNLEEKKDINDITKPIETLIKKEKVQLVVREKQDVTQHLLA